MCPSLVDGLHSYETRSALVIIYVCVLCIVSPLVAEEN